MGGSKMDIATKVDAGKLTPAKIALIVLGVVAMLVAPIALQLTGYSFLVRILALVGIYSLMAVGLNVVVGYAGLLDLGYIAFMAMGAYAGILLGTPVAEALAGGTGFTFWTLLPVAAFVGALTGIALGTPVLRLRGDYLAIVTLGFGEIVRIVLVNWRQVTNGPKGITLFSEPFYRPAGYQESVDAVYSATGFSVTEDIWWYYLIVAMLALAIFVVRRLDNSRLGRSWVAMREDEVAAASVGVNIMTTKLWAFSLGAMWGGFAGILFGYYQGFVSPESFQFMDSVLIVCMVVLGGMGSIPGAILGAGIIIGLPELIRYFVPIWVNNASTSGGPLASVITPELANTISSSIDQYRVLIFGLLMVVMMALRPQGIWPSRRRSRELHPDDEVILDEENLQHREPETIPAAADGEL